MIPVNLQGSSYGRMLAKLDGDGLIGEIATILVHPDAYGIGDIAEMRRAIMERLKLTCSCDPKYAAVAGFFDSLSKLEALLDTKHQDIEDFRP